MAAREGLRIRNKEYDILTAAYKNAGQVKKLIEENEAAKGGADEGLSRVRVGTEVRSLGATWHSQLLCALLVELVPVWKTGADGTPGMLIRPSLLICLSHSVGPGLTASLYYQGRKHLQQSSVMINSSAGYGIWGWRRHIR